MATQSGWIGSPTMRVKPCPKMEHGDQIVQLVGTRTLEYGNLGGQKVVLKAALVSLGYNDSSKNFEKEKKLGNG